MHRELGDERARYGRKSLREQFGDVLAWPASHRAATAVALVVVIGGALLYVATARPIDPRALAVGDCLYVPTEAAKDPVSTRPIGEPSAVEDIVVRLGAQQASCASSHGHEVSAIVTGPEPSPSASGGPAFDRDAVHRLTQPLCDAAFATFVGHALAGSAYVTFPVVPEAPAWLADGRRTICLVARADGQWMDHPARGSAQ